MANHSEHKHVLIVDNDPMHLRNVEAMLRASVPAARVTSTRDVTQARGVIEREGVDLVITDLAMRILAGVDQMLEVAHCRLLIPLLVMTACGGPQAETFALSGGAIEYFEKPLDPEAFLRSVTGLLHAGEHRSQIEVVSLAGFMRLVSMERKTCALRVKAGERTGVLFFSTGSLVDAREGERGGMSAALEILTWQDVSITLDSQIRPRSRTIHASVREVLFHANRMLEEREQARIDAQTPTLSVLPAQPEYQGGVLLPPLETLANSETEVSAARQITPMPAPMPYRAPMHSPVTGSAPTVSAAPEFVGASVSFAVRRPAARPMAAHSPRAPQFVARVKTASPLVPVLSSMPVAPCPPASESVQVDNTAADAGLVAASAAPEVVAPAAVCTTPVAAIDPFADCHDYFDVMDRARDMIRSAQWEAAGQALKRALVLRPGDRVALQNYRMLARRGCTIRGQA